MKIINSHVHVSESEIQEILRDCYFHPEGIRCQQRKGDKIVVKYAIEHLWFAEKICVSEYEYTQTAIRDILINNACPCDIDIAFDIQKGARSAVQMKSIVWKQ